MRREVWRNLARVDDHLQALRVLVRIADAGEFLDEPCARLGVAPLAVALLADFERRGDENLDESAHLFDHLAHAPPGRRVRRDRRAYCNTAMARDLRGDVGDSQDVDVAMFAREPELARKMLADEVAVEQGHAPPAELEELGEQRICNRRLARTRKAGE